MEPIKPQLDAVTVGSFAVSLLGVMPNVITGITTIITLAWSCIRLYETTTIQNLLARRRAARELVK